MAAPLDLDGVLAGFPVGDWVSGRVSSHLRPGTGLHVDLGRGARGFVDGEHLPSYAGWPEVGVKTEFEVLAHHLYRRWHRCQVRLLPLDPRFRPPRQLVAFGDRRWAAIRARHPVGSVVTATVKGVSPGNRWYTVTFGEVWSPVTYFGQPPEAGSTAEYVVTKLLGTTHRILVAPVQ